MAKYTEAQARAIKKYQAGKCKITLTVEPEQRERWQKHAEKQGLSLTALITSLLEKDMERGK